MEDVFNLGKRVPKPRVDRYEGEIPLKSPKSTSKTTQRKSILEKSEERRDKSRRFSMQRKVDFSTFGPGDLINIFQSALEKAPNGKKTLNELKVLKQVDNNYKARNIVERGWGAKKQCQRVLTEARDRNANCWLCGLTMREYGTLLSANEKPFWTTGAERESDTDNAPECEHLIPVSAALIYFDVALYEEDIQSTQMEHNTADSQKYFKLNYRWAHSKCNMVKSDKLFFNMRDSTGNLLFGERITYNDSAITNYLDQLLNSSPELREYSNTFPDWKNTRFNKIKEELAPLYDFLTGQGGIFASMLGVNRLINHVSSYYNSVRRFIEKSGDTDTLAAMSILQMSSGGKRKRNNKTRRRKRNV
jgi:hypothetical protein